MALLGKIGSGKSTVGAMFGRRGAELLRADDASRAVLARGEALLERVTDVLGPQFRRPDGSLDRGAVGELIFRDSQARRRLEELTHPAIIQWLRQQIARLRACEPPPPLIVVEALFLPEHLGAHKLADKVAVCMAPYEVRLQRLVDRDRISLAEARLRLDVQESQQRDPCAPDFVIDTSGCLRHAEQQVAAIWGELVGATAADRPEGSTQLGSDVTLLGG